MEESTNLMLALFGLILIQYLLLNLVRFLKRYWWDPIRITKFMEKQGIRGPPYKFLHGSTAEANELMASSMAMPMELSHDVLSKIQPHFHSWIKLYGIDPLIPLFDPLLSEFFFLNIYETGRNILTWHGPTPRLVVGEPELAKEILSDRDGLFPKYEPPVFMKKLLGDGLVTSTGQKWARQRKLATQAFHTENLKGMIPKVIASVESMLENWIKLDGKEVDFFKDFTILTSEIISRTSFGSSYIEGKEIFTKIDELTLIAARNFETVRLPLLRMIFTYRKLVRNKDEVEAEKIEQDIKASVLKLIMAREKRKESGDGDDYGDDLLGSFMRAHHETGSITVDDIVDECKTFYFAGQETSSIMLSWASFLLAINTDWQDKVRMEVKQLFGDRSPSSEDSAAIARLKTMTMVLNEALRLYPPILNVLRTVARDCKVGDVLLPKGMHIQISQLVVHHDPSTWGDEGQLFSPEKFADGVAGATASGAAFFPFGFGPRFCVGQGLAMLEAKVALAMILQRYSFTLSPAYAHSPVSRLTCRPLHGIQAVLKRL
ncbi:Cytochrome P450 734A1 [Platanthera zijinensis]|uniref:Cytochrome P450 734A1 n=1 Tax=Platanthera zijinensis TaxID=2320716 RepID=A0AAP0BSP3_9ASPA